MMSVFFCLHGPESAFKTALKTLPYKSAVVQKETEKFKSCLTHIKNDEGRLDRKF